MAEERTKPPLGGRQNLKGIARNIAHKFSCSAEHFAWIACQYRQTQVSIDLLNGHIFPSVFDIDRNRNLVGMCRDTLYYNLEILHLTEAVCAAALTVHFSIDGSREGDNLSQASFVVTLIDDTGKVRRGEVTTNNMLVMP